MNHQMNYYSYPAQHQYQYQQIYYPQSHQATQYSQSRYVAPQPYSPSPSSSSYGIKQEYESPAQQSESDLYSSSPSSPVERDEDFEDFEYGYKSKGRIPRIFGKAYRRGKKIHLFLATMLTYLKDKYFTIGELAIQLSYKYAAFKLYMSLPKKMKDSVCKFLKERAGEIISVDEELGHNLYADAIVKNKTGSTIIIDWKTGQCYDEDFSKMKSMLEAKNLKKGYIFYLDAGEYHKVELESQQNNTRIIAPGLEERLNHLVRSPYLLEHFGQVTYLQVLGAFLNNPQDPWNNGVIMSCFTQEANTWQDDSLKALRDAVRLLFKIE